MAPPQLLNLMDEEKRLLWRLRTHGAQARSDLAQALQVSHSAITKLSRGLLTLGLIEEIEGTNHGRGRPTVPLRVSAAGGYAVGVTMYTGIMEIALVDYAGGAIARTIEKIDPIDPWQFGRLMDKRIHELAVEHRLLTSRLYGVGLSVPGPALSRDGNRWNVVHNWPGWQNVPLLEIMGDTLGLPVWIENDAAAAALAEYYLGGLIKRCSTAVVLLLGHGVGAGIVHQGQLMRGETGSAGEIGMFYPNGHPRPTTLDLLACLREEGCCVNSVADVCAVMQHHDATIERWLDRAAEQLLQAVNSAIAWIDPGALRLMSPLPISLMQRLADRLNGGRLIWGDHRVLYNIAHCDIEVSELGGAGPALGAALLPIHASIARNSNFNFE
jgi:predicted NBD/HSP70 family sugar kinase